MKKVYLILFLISSISFSQNNNLIAEWKLDGNTNDSSGNNNNAPDTFQVRPTVNRFGEENKAFYFDGVVPFIFSTNINIHISDRQWSRQLSKLHVNYFKLKLLKAPSMMYTVANGHRFRK